MTDKIDLYDVLSTLIPGLIAVSWLPLLFPSLFALPAPKFPDAFKVLALSAVAFVAGQIIQAIASLIDPYIGMSGGELPSTRALTEGLNERYLTPEEGLRIAAKIKSAMGGEPSPEAMFRYAMRNTDMAGIGRAPRFNGLYAYHRSLLVLGIFLEFLFLVSLALRTLRKYPTGAKFGVGIGLALLVVLLWYRTTQRRFYYVREVLLTQERLLDEQAREDAQKACAGK